MKKLLTTSGLIIGLIAFLALNIVTNGTFKSARLDLTDGDLYTLSQGTHNILQNLQEPVTLRFYLSQKLLTQLPTVNTYAVRVKELLQEYERLANGKLKLHVIEPEPFSEAEDQAVGLGLQGVPLDTSNTTFYFGLAGSNSTDDEEVIAFFQPNREEFLEYDVTKLVYQLSNPKQKVVGVLSTLPIQGGGAMSFLQSDAKQAWMAIEQLGKSFDVRSIETNATRIEQDVDVLMIVHPTGFSDSLLYAIDQYVLNGGRVMVFADPYSEAYEPPTDPKNPLSSMNAPRNSDLAKLFDAWGVELVSGKVVGDLTVAKKVQARSGQKMVVVNYPVWMDLSAEHMSQEDIITGKLDDITVATAGILKAKDGATTTFTPLLQSSDKAMQIDITKLGMFSNPESLVREFKPGGEKLTMAARIGGPLKTAFPNGKPNTDAAQDEEEKPAEAEPAAEHLTESKEAANIIIVADTDILDDQFWVQVQNFFGQRIAIPNAANGTFLSNALDNLSGSNDLISVRNRGSFSRPFTKVEALQQEAEQRFREKEQSLTAKLKQTEQQIRDLQNQKPQGGGDLMLSAEQQQALLGFRDEQIKTRKELRAVQHELRKDIERLEGRMKFINIGLMPLLVGFVGIGLSIYSTRRRRGLKVAK